MDNNKKDLINDNDQVEMNEAQEVAEQTQASEQEQVSATSNEETQNASSAPSKEKDNKQGGDNVIKATPIKRQVSPTGFIEKVVQIKRISKTTKGGRNMRFSALVVIGNKKGEVGFGMGKSIEVPDAIRKALKNANNNIKQVKINKNGTVFHEEIGKHGASRILVKPAPEGTGIIAGGPVRAVVELAGYHDIYTKCMGSSTPINVIRATINGLTNQYTPSEIAKLREKKISEL